LRIIAAARRGREVAPGRQALGGQTKQHAEVGDLHVEVGAEHHL
jgi:hypothetical protein